MRLSREDRWLTGWLILSVLAGLAMIGVNAARSRFTGISYLPREFTPLIALALNAAVTGCWIRERAPRKSFLLISGGFYGLIMIASAVLVTGAQYAPFPPIDLALARWDARLGWDTAASLRWMAARPALRAVLNHCYDSTDAQLVLAPLVAGLAFDRRRMRVYLYALVYSFLAGTLFYYFFPSSGPGAVVLSPDFLSVQRATFMKFRQVRDFQPVTTILGGMIAFPSFHVAWSVLLSYAALPKKWIFWPIAALNAVVIVSTVVLGWHFLVDVPAGLLLAAASLSAGEFTHRRLCGNGVQDRMS